jgi:hypothetical protein
MNNKQKNKTSGKNSSQIKVGFWLVCIAASVFAWSIIDTPLGKGIPTKGLVTGYQLSGHSQKMGVIEMRDGTVIRKTGVFTPIGGYVDCLRYEKKYLPTESYECP